jgi:hypothetical protein
MADILTLAKKLERGYRNQTCVRLTIDEQLMLADLGMFEAVAVAKSKELEARCRAKRPPTSSATTGSTSVVTAPPPMSGKSPPIGREAAKSYIAALSARA